MKKTFLMAILLASAAASHLVAQDISASKVPAAVMGAFVQKYPDAKKVSWEKENGNFEANWGGKSGEDNSAQFTPSGVFVEIVLAIAVDQLPANIAGYVKTHYKATIKEAGKVTDAAGKLSYEAEIKGKDLIFDEAGNFVKEDKD